MPYIPPATWEAFLPHSKEVPENEGQLNFQISCLFNEYMMKHGLHYNRMGDCVGAAENAVAEFRRRVMDPYEDRKRRENGDVYDADLTGASSWVEGRSG